MRLGSGRAEANANSNEQQTCRLNNVCCKTIQYILVPMSSVVVVLLLCCML